MSSLQTREHPMQPIGFADDGCIRFKPNKIVQYLLDAGTIDLNQLSLMPFTDADWDQFYQLIGYSVSGYCDLSNVGDDAKDAAYKKARRATTGGISRDNNRRR